MLTVPLFSTAYVAPEAHCVGSDTVEVVTSKGQWEFALEASIAKFLPTEPARRNIGVRVLLEVRVTKGMLGIGIQFADRNGFYEERVISPSGGWEKVEVFGPNPELVGGLIIRNVSPHGESEARIRVLDIGIGNRPQVPPRYILIHQPGKVASQTVEAVFAAALPHGRVERHHALTEATLAKWEATLGRPGVEMGPPYGMDIQIANGRAARRNLHKLRGPGAWILCGFRDPMDFAVSVFFQALATNCPDLTLAREVHDAELQQVIARFNNSFLRGELQTPEEWFQEEIIDFYNLDIFSLAVGNLPYVVTSNGQFDFLFYRFEDLRISLPDIVARLGLKYPETVAHRNIGSEKATGRLYSAFREAFVPTIEMARFCYDTRFFRHFYGDAPNYQSLPAGIRRARLPYLGRK